MTTLFYLTTIIFIWANLKWVIAPIEETQKLKNFNGLLKSVKGKEWNDYPKELKSMIKSKFWLLWILIWYFIGLFTAQWVGFLSLFLFGIITSMITTPFKYTIFRSVISWFHALINVVVSVFLIINHYHLKINLTELFIELFK